MTAGASLPFLFGQQAREYLRPKRLLVWIAVVIAVTAVAMAFRSTTEATSKTQAYVMISSVLVYRLLALSAAIFATDVIAREVEQKTIVYLLTRPVPRWRLLLARTLAASLATFAVSALAAVAASFVAYRGLGEIFWRDLPALAIGSLTYVSLFVLVSLLVNRAMLVCLLFAFGWETAVPNLPDGLYWLSINPYLTAIARHPQSAESGGPLDLLGGMAGTNTLTPMVGWSVTVILSAVCLAIAMLWFTSFEYTPREDAE